MNNDNILKSAFVPSISIGAILVLALSVIKHKSGFWGAILGLATVLIFLSVHLLINRFAGHLDPIAVMALAMFSYFAKIALMGIFLVVVSKATSPGTVNRIAFAITALSVTVIWLAAEIRAYLRLRPQLPLPNSGN